MKYLKVLITAIIVLAAVSGAIATNSRRCFDCSNATLYYYNGSTYNPAGTYGWDFYCDGNSGVCVYYRPDPVLYPNYYAICRYGIYTRIP